MKIFKILFYNFIIFFLFFFLIELLFGYWMDKDSLGPYMREHRMKKNFYTLSYKDQTLNYTYKRNYFGFRGEDIKLEDIKSVMIGGSTADERYKPEEFTIVGFLNKKILKEKIGTKIINAGIEGQSTIGHIYNFEIWFPKLKKFKPDFFIFYVGINDHLRKINEDKSSNGHVLNPSKAEQFKDNIKSRSIFYDLLRKIKHKYYNKGEVVVYDFNKAIERKNKLKKFRFLNYDEAIKKYDIDKLKKENELLIKDYLSNIDKLANYSKLLNSKPIFINQLTENGNYNKKLFILNYSLINHCKKRNYDCIDLARQLVGEDDFWWDGIHTTPKGSQKIADLIFLDLKKILKKD